jgi:integrase
MAQLMKRPSSPFYYARFQVKGKDRWLSTGESDRKKARKELARLVAQARNQWSIGEQLARLIDMVDALPEKDQPLKRQEIVRTVLRAQEKKIALAEVWTRWLKNPNKEYDPKPKTLLGYAAIWKQFNGWAATRNLHFLHEITAEDAGEYAAHLWKSRVSASTYNQHIKFLRSLCQAIELEAGLVGNPWARIMSTKKNQGGGRRNLTPDELQTVLARAEGNMRSLMIVGLFTGLRLADVVNLKGENIDHNPFAPDTGPRPGFIVVKPRKTDRVNKVVEVPMHPSLAALLRDLKGKAKAGYLFPEEQSLHAKDPSNLTMKIQAFFESCGLKTNEEIGEGHRRRAIVRVGFHSLRHTFVSLCAHSGAPLHIVQKLVGHGSPMLTADKYLHIDKADKLAAIEGLPSLGLKK